ncbi:MAG: NAD(P)-dependent oxidoreductase [Planctomyces sp.]|nr:NAD(P)-dependent oxidoreductase [Planctomyces sp.]
MTVLGLIGTGLLGTAIAERLISDGHHVIGYDTNAESLRQFRQLGGTAADSAQDVYSQCLHVFLSLPDSSIVRSVIAAVPLVQAGTLVIDTTTGAPADAMEISELLSKWSASYLDATIAGSSEQVKHREAVAMVGGTLESYQSALPLLSCFTCQQFHTGANGSGSTVKLIVNLVLGLNRLVLAEGLSLAASCGVNLPMVLEILKSGAAYSRVMDVKGEKMIRGEFSPPQARLDQHWKDVRLILELGRQHQQSLPLSELHEQLLEQASKLGCGSLDNSSIIKVLSKS